MKSYNSPEIEIIEIETNDVIATSGNFDVEKEGIFNGIIEWI